MVAFAEAVVDVELGFFVLEHVYSCEGGGLGLGGCLGLRDHVITVAAIP